MVTPVNTLCSFPFNLQDTTVCSMCLGREPSETQPATHNRAMPPRAQVLTSCPLNSLLPQRPSQQACSEPCRRDRCGAGRIALRVGGTALGVAHRTHVQVSREHTDPGRSGWPCREDPDGTAPSWLFLWVCLPSWDRTETPAVRADPGPASWHLRTSSFVPGCGEGGQREAAMGRAPAERDEGTRREGHGHVDPGSAPLG